jgi:hypothetical protein
VLFWVITQRVVVIFTDVSRQPIGSKFRGQESGFFTPEFGTDKLSRNVGKNYHYLLRNSPEEHSSYLRRVGSQKSRTEIDYFVGLQCANVFFSAKECPEISFETYNFFS